MSFKPHWINPAHFLVRINRAEQKKRRETLGNGLLVADHKSSFMTRNMQHGEILMIGSKTLDFLQLPMTQIGDHLIFTHFIEGSTEHSGNKVKDELNNEYLLEQDEEYNYYIVPLQQVYGIMKSDGTIFPQTKHIFAIFHKDEYATEESKTQSGLIVFDNYKDTDEFVQHKIDEIKTTLQGTNNHEAQVRLTLEMEELSKRLNAQRFGKFHPLFVHQNFHRDCGRKITNEDVLYYIVKGANNVKAKPYELEINGVSYFILNVDSVCMVSKDEPLRIEEVQTLVTDEGIMIQEEMQRPSQSLRQ